jgi:hypothetical protein
LWDTNNNISREKRDRPHQESFALLSEVTKKAGNGCFIICLFFGTPVEHLNLNKNDVKSRLAGAGFPVMNTGQAARRPTDSKLEPFELPNLLKTL